MGKPKVGRHGPVYAIWGVGQNLELGSLWSMRHKPHFGDDPIWGNTPIWGWDLIWVGTPFRAFSTFGLGFHLSGTPFVGGTRCESRAPWRLGNYLELGPHMSIGPHSGLTWFDGRTLFWIGTLFDAQNPLRGRIPFRRGRSFKVGPHLGWGPYLGRDTIWGWIPFGRGSTLGMGPQLSENGMKGICHPTPPARLVG